MAAEFPKATLEQALAFPNALQKNGGNPMTVIDLATAVNKSPGSSAIRTLGAASSAYGLTGGGVKSTVSMAELGGAITAPRSTDERALSLVSAALRPPLFKRVYEYYKNKKVPEHTYLVNTVVREFKVDAKQAESFADIFIANMKFVGSIKSTPGGDWLAEGLSTGPAQASASDDPKGVDPDDRLGGQEKAQLEPPPPTGETPKKKRPNRLFVGHGPNKKPVDQLTKVLRNLGIPYQVAEDEASAGRPISKKVRDTMEGCGAGILIFSADVEYFDKDGNSVWRPSENVSHELGAAAVMYDDRIILFKEDEVTLASNFSGSGYITFEKDKLDAKTNELLRELVALKILRMSVSDDD